MADNIIPGVGVQGVFTLLSPFKEDIIENASYTLIAVRYISDMVASGENPYTDIYQPHTLAEVTYQQDSANKVCILTLQSNSGAVFKVPNSYVVSYPSQGGVPYTGVMLGVKLGAIPDSIDLTLMMQQIKDLILNKIGIESQIKQAVIATTKMIPQADNEIMEANRQSKITDNTTDYAKFLAADARATTLQTQVTVLEQFIIDHPVTPTPTP